MNETPSAAPACAAPRSSRVRASRSCGAVEHGRQRLGDQRRAGERVLVAGRVAGRRVERLGRVGERVQRRAARLAARQVERQPRLVDDAGELRAAAAALDALLLVARAEERRPLGARVGRRDGDDRAGRSARTRPSPCRSRCRRRTGRPRRRPPPARPRPRRVSAGVCVRTPVKRRSTGTSASANRRARDQQRPVLPTSASTRPELGEPPADDHAGSRSRAKATNASAARVSARPLERTSEISRAGSRPSTRAADDRAGRELGLDRRAAR